MNEEPHQPTVLLIGPLPTPAEVSGGTKMRQLGRRGFDLVVLDTTRQRANLPRWRQQASIVISFSPKYIYAHPPYYEYPWIRQSKALGTTFFRSLPIHRGALRY